MGPRSGSCPECLDDDAILEFVEKKLPAAIEQRVHDHIGTCAACRRLVAEAGKYYYEAQSHAETLTRPAATRRDRDVELAPGRIIGRYAITRSIGSGGMGIVYEAYDPQLRRRIALKLLRWHHLPDDAQSRARQVRLLREAQAMAQLSDPNVVAVFDAGELDGQVYMAMELVAGVTLAEWLASARRSVDDIVAVYEQAARGLAAAHAAGLVHRDFKPQNVLVGEDGRVRVTDFGLACEAPAVTDEPEPITAVAEALTRTGTLCGTPAYMAPEQFEGRTADTLSDQFNFCVAFYEALHGERPFGGGSMHELAGQVRSGRIAPPRKGAPVPPALQAIVMRGLRVAPRERFASMIELIDELARRRRLPAPRPRTRRNVLALAFATVAVPVIAWFATRAAAPTVAASAAPAPVPEPTAPAPPPPTPTPTQTATQAVIAKPASPPARVRVKRAKAKPVPSRAPASINSRTREDALKPLEEP